MSIGQHDQVSHFWCPQLGQTLNFAYCRTCQDGLPCARVIQCYAPHFEVAAFLEEHYTPAERERFLAPGPGRMQTVANALAAACPKPHE